MMAQADRIADARAEDSDRCFAPDAGIPAGLLAAIVDHAEDGIAIADASRAGHPIIAVNPAFERITGYSQAEAVGRGCLFLQRSDALQPDAERIARALAQGEQVATTVRNYRKDGTPFWNELRLVPVEGGGAVPLYCLAYIRDVSEQLRTAMRLGDAIHTDRLTGCLQRDTFVEEVTALAMLRRLLLVQIDIAHFADINRAHGHDAGDALLVELGRRLGLIGADRVARIGSDQFALAFTLTDRAAVPARLALLRHLIGEDYAIGGGTVKVRFAIGYVAGETRTEGMTLLRQAGAALDRSKASSLRAPCGFDSEDELQARTRARMAVELRQGLAGDRFVHHFQPKVDLASGALIGAEALLRWRHDDLGLLEPAAFLGLADDSGILLDIAARGFRRIVEQAVRINCWRQRPLNFSINASRIEFTHRDMVGFLADLLGQTGARPAWLTLELADDLTADDSPEMLHIFHSLRELGVGLSVRGFGASPASLRHVESFPLSEIKIGRPLVADLPHSAAARVVAASLIELGSVLDAAVVAEGVETEAERALLRTMRCPQAQGRLFGEPLPAHQFALVAEESFLLKTMA